MQFTPTNDLEHTLAQAARDPAARPRFYQLLLESTLLVLVPPNSAPAGARTFTQSEKVPLVIWKKDGRDSVPMFSSVPLLQQTAQHAGQDFHYLALRGKDLFGMLASGPLSAVLNPNCPIGKEFLVEEIRDIASGKFFEMAKPEVIQKERKVLLGQPSEYPQALVDALKRHLGTQPQVEAAYLAQIADSASGATPHLMFAISLQGEIDPVMQPLLMIAREILGPKKTADFVVLGRGGSLDDYFLTKTQPFYKKSP
ncbi:MAG TPA: enhanced serine sensitivity protein SseB C-terminal domain-containing protein [Candidatus Acidoferrales bacterium]|jgi:hypothetical protein|nr:enhanced serine sensitivity protein SseB C-terminal domain-containing protein [Candidatus Acidoferrales bacterium]